MNTKISVILFIVLLAIILISCDDTLPDNTIVIPDKDVSYSTYIQPVFHYHCNNSGCHNSIDRAGGVDLTTWEGATDLWIVRPGDPNSSILVWSIEGISGSNPMPPPGQGIPLTINQIEGIKTWIKEGAESN